MRHVLIIAYYFPPDGGAGSQRPAKFCKYLPDFGWKAVVVTHPLEIAPSTWNPVDQELMSDIGEQTTVLREDFSSIINYKNELSIIRSPLYTIISKAICQYSPEIIMITMSPYKLCHLGKILKRNFELPVIYDLRDPWALDGVQLYRSKFTWKKEFSLMRTTFAEADGIIANTPEAAKVFQRIMPESNHDRIAVVTNGYDADDFKKMTKNDVQIEKDKSLFYMIHTGSFLSSTLYKKGGISGWLRKRLNFRPEPVDPTGRTPLYILSAIRSLRDSGHLLGRILKLVLVGQADLATMRCIEESGVSDSVQATGYVSHLQSIKYLYYADALFLHLHDLPTGHRSLIVPGKTYEYIASGKYILGCLPKGDAHDIVESSGRGFCAKPSDAESITRALIRLYEAFRRGPFHIDGNYQSLSKYERKELTRSLTVFFDYLSKSKC